MQIDAHPNGGAYMMKTDWQIVRKNLNKEECERFADELVSLGLAESKEGPLFVVCIIDNGADYLDVICFFKIN